MASNDNRRRNALTANDLLKQLPASARANHLNDKRANENQLVSKSTAKQQLIESIRPKHARHGAFDWTAFSEAVTCITPTKPLYPTSELSPPHVPSSSRYVDGRLIVTSCDRKINELRAHVSQELSSLEYSSSDDSTTGSVSEDIERVIAKSVFDFSNIETNTARFQCAICLERPINDDSIASVSGCNHRFCFEVSAICVTQMKMSLMKIAISDLLLSVYRFLGFEKNNLSFVQRGIPSCGFPS